MNEIGLIIGRFQPFHIGHQLLIDTSLSENNTTLILIGSSNVSNDQNPYPYEKRKEVIQANYPDINIIIGKLPDFDTDEQWSEYILDYIPKDIFGIDMYCGDRETDSAVRSLLKLKNKLPFTLNIKEIPRSIIPISSTQVREWDLVGEKDKLKKFLSPETIDILEL